ncbi:MAG: formylglycine-generating enzyme family protein [Planctomycetes bacterium]|nr:formylglycine-generating enzyme family protein [Planctomycetota bacterium]
MEPPDAATQDKNLKLARMIFEKEYAQGTPEARRRLVATLLDEAGNIKKNFDAKFVLLEQARNLAAEVGDAKSCRQAIEQLDEGFTVDAAHMAADALARLLPPSGADVSVAAWGVEVLAGLIDVDRYETASKLLNSFPATGLYAKEAALAASLKGLKADLAEYARVKPALEKLKTDPADPAANLAAGRFYCFTRDDWPKGLPLLARGSDATLRDLAAQDLAGPTEASAQLALGNLWWEAAKGPGVPAEPLRSRAGYWYEKALPGLKDLEEVLARKRLSDLAASPAARSGPAARPGALRVPHGFRAKPGTVAEPYTRTGWARQIVHAATGIELVFIPAGRFLMGSPENEEKRSDNETQHEVILTRPFYMGAREVTQGQWQKVMGDNPSANKGSDTLPVEHVSWDDCQAFCQKAGGGLRLPTEAEWEYACRAGIQTPFNTGQTISTDQANYDGNYIYGSGAKGVFRRATVPVGGSRPNAWGLHDMHGNVWEWCADWSGAYPGASVTDPTGAPSGTTRVMRGGAWDRAPYYYPSSFDVVSLCE